MPSETVVKELPTARTQKGEDVLEVRSGACRSAKRRRIEWAPPRGEEKDARDTAAEFETSRMEVPMRQPIAREVEHWPEEERRESRPARRASRSARRHMERDDHSCRLEQVRVRSSRFLTAGEALEDRRHIIGRGGSPSATAT
jgi:hypothetical protein